MYKRGDILEATNRNPSAGKHFIVYYDGYNDEVFIGAMITHSPKYGNIPMENEHFETIDENGDTYKIIYKNTYLVIAKLDKFVSWGPFKRAGKLTLKGISFVENKIDLLEPQTWEEYISK